MLADGLARGGPDEARKRLADFWRAASLGGNLPDVQRRAIDRLFSFWPIEDTPVGLWMQALSRYLSPYDFNPLNINPLKDLIERFVDFDAVRACTDLQLFVSATNVQTGELHVFKREEMTADMIVASACLPHLFPCRRDRRRALLGRRLCGQSGALSAGRRDPDRKCAAGPDQSAASASKSRRRRTRSWRGSTRSRSIPR